MKTILAAFATLLALALPAWGQGGEPHGHHVVDTGGDQEPALLQSLTQGGIGHGSQHGALRALRQTVAGPRKNRYNSCSSRP